MVTSLEKSCIDFLIKNLTPNNVFDVLAQCLKWEVSAELLKKCKQFLQKQTKDVLQTDSFSSIDLECLIVLLEQNFLSVTEGELFKKVGLIFGFLYKI